MEAREIYELAPTSTRTAFEAAAGRSGRPVLEVIDEAADMQVAEVRWLVLEWPLVALATGHVLGVARERIRVNLTRSLRQRMLDANEGFSFRVFMGLPDVGIPERSFDVSFRMREFDGGDVVRRFPALLVRQDATPINVVVNVPEQAPPVVNVTIEQVEPTPENVEFTRLPNGLIKSATITPAE